MQSVRLSFAVFFLAATAVQAAAPRAACESDADCGANQFCALADCGAPCDPDDAACEPSDCGSGGGICVDNDPGEPVEPTNCTSDADCSGTDVCLTFERTSCSASGGGADPGAPDEPDTGGGDDAAPPRDPEEPVCETESASICAPRWYADCDVDADCGTGFTCEFLDTSTCACTAPDGDDATDECSCEESTSDVGVCVLIDTPCTEDTDCGEDLFCTKYDEETPVLPCDAQTGEGCDLGDDNGGNGPEGGSDEAQAPAEGFCAPLGYSRGDDVGTEEPATGGEGEGELPVNEGGEGEGEDTDGEPVDDVTYDDAIFCASTGGSPVGLLPFAALALVLRRRRR